MTAAERYRAGYEAWRRALCGERVDPGQFERRVARQRALLVGTRWEHAEAWHVCSFCHTVHHPDFCPLQEETCWGADAELVERYA